MNFIIYEDDEKFKQYYKNIIFELMGYSKLNYSVISYNETNTKLINSIYLIDLDSYGSSGLNYAKKIREDGDWSSPIIFISYNAVNINEYYNLLVLGYWCKKDISLDNLMRCLKVALKINSSKDIFSFSVKNEFYQIPVEEILYIEKNLNDNSSIIVTKENEYIVRKSIVTLEKELGNSNNFYKTHRSCIVNVNNIRNVNFEQGVIEFDKCRIDLLSRANKKGLRNKLNLEHI